MASNDESIRSVEYYLERAAECERLAAAAMTEDNREIFLRLAARWRRAAEERSPPDDG
jgi:hypothetical protein